MNKIFKYILSAIIVLTMWSCGETGSGNSTTATQPQPTQSETNNKTIDARYFALPTILKEVQQSKNMARQIGNSSAEVDEKELIKTKEHIAGWVYYTDKNSTRWYISSLFDKTEFYGDIYSLMKIVDGVAGWATVAKDAVDIEVDDEYIYLYADEDLQSDTNTTYWDAGYKKYVTNDRILGDRQMIQGDEVIGKWYFFYMPETSSWYISTTFEYEDKMGITWTTVHKFSYDDKGEYKWIPVLDEGNNYTTDIWDDDGVIKINFVTKE